MNTNTCPCCRQIMRLWALYVRRFRAGERIGGLSGAEGERVAVRTAESFRDECLGHGEATQKGGAR